MNYKIISDSSSDILEFSDVNYSTVPLKIITAEKEFTDDLKLDTKEMLDYLEKYSGRSGSACPNMDDWKNSFGDAENIFCITITSGLSGSYNSASAALSEHLETHPNCKGHIIDSLSVGPESALIIEKLSAIIAGGADFEETVRLINEYKKHTHLIFGLRSLHNLATNGRVNPVVAKVAGILGIRIIGKASNKGILDITNKSRGAEKAISDIIKNMNANGYKGGKVRIHHCENENAAESIKSRLLALYPEASVTIKPANGLCCFYAERGGVLIGYEGAEKQ